MKTPGTVPIIALAIINGIFSPQLIAVFALQGLWYPFFLPANLSMVFTTSSLILSTLYLMVSGVPAALYEKLAGGGQTSFNSRMVWLVTMAVFTLPTLPNVLRAFGMG